MVRKSVPTKYVLSFIALIVANMIWAAAGPVIKLTVAYVPPYTFLFLRFLLVCILILPFTIMELVKSDVNPKDYFKIILLGLFAQSSIIFVFLGLQYTTAVDAAIIGSITVLLSMGAGHYFFNEKMNAGVKTGILFALLGTFVVIVEPLFTTAGPAFHNSIWLRIWGNILVSLNNLAFLFYIIWSKISLGQTSKIIKKTLHFIHIKPMTKKYPSSLLTSLSFFVGMISILPFALLESNGYFGVQSFNLLHLGTKAFAGIAFMAIFSSIAAYYLFEWALTVVNVGDTAILGYLSSIMAIPFAYILLGEIPGKYTLLGAGIISAGVIISEVSAHYHKIKTLKKH